MPRQPRGAGRTLGSELALPSGSTTKAFDPRSAELQLVRLAHPNSLEGEPAAYDEFVYYAFVPDPDEADP